MGSRETHQVCRQQREAPPAPDNFDPSQRSRPRPARSQRGRADVIEVPGIEVGRRVVPLARPIAERSAVDGDARGDRPRRPKAV